MYKFRLKIVDLGEPDVHLVNSHALATDLAHNRIIPSAVKQAVWKRDQGKCIDCGSKSNLHFNHILPFSKGGSSVLVDNIQLLCVRHTLKMLDKLPYGRVFDIGGSACGKMVSPV